MTRLALVLALAVGDLMSDPLWGSRKLAGSGLRCGTIAGHRDHLRVNTNDCKECAAALRRERKQAGVLRASPAERNSARDRCEHHCAVCGYYVPHGGEHLTADDPPLIAHPWCNLTALGVDDVCTLLTRTEHAHLHSQPAAQSGKIEVSVEGDDDWVWLTAECPECDWWINGEVDDGASTISTNYDDDPSEGSLTRAELTDKVHTLIGEHNAVHEKHRVGKPATQLPDPVGPDVEWIGYDRGDDYYIKLGMMREVSRKADEENFSPAMLEEHDRHDGSDLRRWIYAAVMDIRDETAAERRARFAADLAGATS